MPFFKLLGKTFCRKGSLIIRHSLVLITSADILTNFGDMPYKSLAFSVSKSFSTLATLPGVVSLKKKLFSLGFFSYLEIGYSFLLDLSIGSGRHLQNSY